MVSVGYDSGACNTQRKALIEALIAQVKITGPGRIVPVFRIPQPPAAEKPQVQANPAITRYMTAGDPVRAMTTLVGPVVSSFRTSRTGVSSHRGHPCQ